MNVPKFVTVKLPHVYGQTEDSRLDQRQLESFCQDLIREVEDLKARIQVLEQQ